MKPISMYIAALFLPLFLFIGGCNQVTEEEKIERKKSPAEKIKFHSEENSGRWKDEVNTHLPQFSVKKEGDNFIISIHVPLKGKNLPLHYIEAIILTDSMHKELKKRSFPRGEGDASAKFSIPADTRFPLYAVIKCNLHDMWESKITRDKIQ